MKTSQDLVKSVLGAGMSEADIARRIGCGSSTVNRVRHGADLSYAKGKRLEMLCREIFGEDSLAA